MQNNDVHGKSAQGWLAKYQKIVIPGALVLIVVFVYYWICKPPVPPGAGDLSFNPQGGTVVNDSLGNNDGQLNPGEQVEMRVCLTNVRKDSIPPFTLVLSPQDTGMVEFINDNRLHFNGIAPGNTICSEGFVKFKLDEDYLFDCLRFNSQIERAAAAGFIGEAFASNGGNAGPPVDMSVYPNYRVCLGSCTLEIGPNATDAAVLTIDVALCNTASSQLEDAVVTIEASSVKTCNSPSPTFNIMTGTTGSHEYSDVGSNQCNPPVISTNRFKYSAPSFLPAQASVCVYFSVQIFRNTSDKVGERNMGMRATVIPRTSSPIALATSGPSR